MKITITIEVKGQVGVAAFAREVKELLPTTAQLEDFRDRIIPAVLPVTFRIVENQKQRAYIEFDD